jgi:hypothetical protein
LAARCCSTGQSLGDLVMSWRQSIALTLFVGLLLTVTELWVLVLVAVPISSAFSWIALRKMSPERGSI